MGETAKKELIKIYVRERYGRDHEIVNKYFEKGIICEEDAIDILSVQHGVLYKKNTERIENEWLTGEPDIYLGESIYNATHVKDVKNMWDLFTFWCKLVEPVRKEYFWQLQGYQMLTNARQASICNVLVSTPDELINDEIRRMQWKSGVIDIDSNEKFKELVDYTRSAMKYEDIPESDRWMEFEVNRDDNEIDRGIERLKECRKLMNTWP